MPIILDRIQGPYIDPLTKDEVYEDGDLKMDETQHSAVLHSLALKHGSSKVDPDAGNKVWNIKKAMRVVPEQARLYNQEVLQPRIDDGRIKDFEVDAEIQGQHVLAWEVGYVDASDERFVLKMANKDMVP
jgi:phage gp46-like protein